MIVSSEFFTTSNTALAAYLVSEGFPIVSTDQTNGKVSFSFEPNSSLAGCIRDFELAQATGNIVMFYNTYRSLLRQIKRGENND